VAREVGLRQLDARIDGDLVQEVSELRRLAGGIDPLTAEPFGRDVRRIFAVHLARNIPSRNESQLAFADGRLVARSRRVAPYRLDRDAGLVARWVDLRTTGRGSASTPAGRVEYLAVPLVADGEVQGVFVDVQFRDREAREVETTVRYAGGAGLAVLLIGSLLAWRVAERVLRPVDELTRTARAISETDLSRRIPVRGHDEISRLADTFNAMLDRLQTAFETHRRFADETGHELKTPITIIRGHIELMGDDPEEREETVAIVNDELDRMLRIVNDLLILAKAEQPGFLDVGTLDLEMLTGELLTKAQALAPRAWSIEAHGSGAFTADRQRLTQAVMQLAENAIRYTADGDRIALGSALADGSVRIWVRDEGPGVPLEEQERIFDRFRQGRSDRFSGGAGLGLSIVRAIAEAHGGTVGVRSVPGEGATFTLEIPAGGPAPPPPDDGVAP
jgi:two-component system, OmpR family, sensor kinase